MDEYDDLLRSMRESSMNSFDDIDQKHSITKNLILNVHESVLVPWNNNIDHRDTTLGKEFLDKELESFIKYIVHTSQEVELRKLVTSLIAGVVQAKFNEARPKVTIFGSTATGLFLPDGDIDLVIQSPYLEHNVAQSIHILRKGLIESRITTHNTSRCVLNAKVPILKFTTLPEFGSFAVDISFNLQNGIDGANLQISKLNSFGLRDEMRIRDLILIVKMFLNLRGLMEVRSGGIGGLTLFCMVVSFIQTHHNTPYVSRGHDLIQFFHYYGTSFNYSKSTIVIDGPGKIVPKGTIRWDKPPNRDISFLSIQHPIDLGRDIASGGYSIHRIRRAFQIATRELFKYFTSTPLSKEEVKYLSSKSILLSIDIIATPEMVRNRRSNTSLFESGRLQKLVKNRRRPIDQASSSRSGIGNQTNIQSTQGITPRNLNNGIGARSLVAPRDNLREEIGIPLNPRSSLPQTHSRSSPNTSRTNSNTSSALSSTSTSTLTPASVPTVALLENHNGSAGMQLEDGSWYFVYDVNPSRFESPDTTSTSTTTTSTSSKSINPRPLLQATTFLVPSSKSTLSSSSSIPIETEPRPIRNLRSIPSSANNSPIPSSSQLNSSMIETEAEKSLRTRPKFRSKANGLVTSSSSPPSSSSTNTIQEFNNDYQSISSNASPSTSSLTPSNLSTTSPFNNNLSSNLLLNHDAFKFNFSSPPSSSSISTKSSSTSNKTKNSNSTLFSNNPLPSPSRSTPNTSLEGEREGEEFNYNLFTGSSSEFNSDVVSSNQSIRSNYSNETGSPKSKKASSKSPRRLRTTGMERKVVYHPPVTDF